MSPTAHGSISHNDVRPSVEATFGGLRKVADTALSFTVRSVVRQSTHIWPCASVCSVFSAASTAERAPLFASLSKTTISCAMGSARSANSLAAPHCLELLQG